MDKLEYQAYNNNLGWRELRLIKKIINYNA